MLFIDAALTSGCACPGDTLTYECTIMSVLGGATVWTGTALVLNCLYGEIVLLHRFISPKGTFRVLVCNNGAIVARSLSIKGNYFTSQLNVIVTPDIAGEIVKCLYDNGYNDTLQFSTVILTTG